MEDIFAKKDHTNMGLDNGSVPNRCQTVGRPVYMIQEWSLIMIPNHVYNNDLYIYIYVYNITKYQRNFRDITYYLMVE